MKHEVTYYNASGNEESRIVESESIAVRDGYLYFITGTDPEVVNDMFTTWIEVVEIEE